MKEKLSAFALLFCLSCFHLAPVFAQTQGNSDINEKIRREELDHSQIMHTLHFFSDVYGPRLTGSPNLKGAEDWALKQMQVWGFDNVHLESWSFGHPGWANERASGFIEQYIFRLFWFSGNC